MADELVSQATPEQQAAAEAIGWIPPERFKGDPAGFVDAAAYLERGEQLLPIIKARNRKLEESAAQTAARLNEVEAALRASQESLAALEEHHTKATRAQVEAARKELITSLKSARESGDVDAEMEILGELTKHEAPPPKVESKPATSVAAPKIDPVVQAWMDSHDWYGKDIEKSIDFDATARKLRLRGNTKVGQEFLADVEAAFEKAQASPGRSSKVESGGPSGESRVNGSAKKRFADLPPDARAACHADNPKLVGSNRRFKDVAAWEQYYTDIYFGMEASA